MEAVVHYFTGGGALCRFSSVAELSIVMRTVTCPACRAMLDQQELEEEDVHARPPPTVRGRLWSRRS